MQEKPVLVVWVNIEVVKKICIISDFTPVYKYNFIEAVNRNEYGMVEQENLIIKYRVTSFFKYIKDIFCE